jgi:acetoacetyl-CoA synthetase
LGCHSSPSVLERPHQLLLLGVHRDHRLAALLEPLHARVDCYASCLKADLSLQAAGDLRKLRAIGATGSPLALECYDWIWRRVPQVDGAPIWLDPISGGTDFAGAFVAGMRTLPVTAGEMQCRCLGAAVEAWSEPDASGRGRALVDEVGELVCTKPMPSMPLCFWGDADGSRYRDSYFDMYPGSGATATGSASRRAAARSSTAAATRRSTGTASAWAPPSCTARRGAARGARLARRRPRIPRRESYMPLFVVLREASSSTRR